METRFIPEDAKLVRLDEMPKPLALRDQLKLVPSILHLMIIDYHVIQYESKSHCGVKGQYRPSEP
jgi:hypothetical protein